MTIYEDRLIAITADTLTLKYYYFPFGISKHLPFASIDFIAAEQPSLLNGQWRIWGTGGSSLWFPLDWARPIRDTIFFVYLKDFRFRIGFTAEDSNRAVWALSDQGVLVR